MENLLKELHFFLKNNIRDGHKVVLPFSGGLNSATALAILRTLYKAEDIVLFHGTHDLNAVETSHAKKIAEQFQTNLRIFDLKQIRGDLQKIMDSILIVRESNENINSVLRTTDMGNIIYALGRCVSREVSGVLIGTIDLDELLTGYFPKECYGGDFLIMGGLFRFELRDLAQYLGIKEFLPEKWAPIPGCGNIARDISIKNKTIGGSHVFDSENDLGNKLSEFISSETKNSEIANLILSQKHKIIPNLVGRPIFFSNEERRRSILKFLD